MLGWMNDCLEKLVIEKFGIDAWHQIKRMAKCDIADGGFLRFEEYPDQCMFDLVQAGSQVSGIAIDILLEEFGRFFVPYIANSGHENLLWCQGNTLKDWATNINAIHSHLQTTFPNKMVMPEFWVEVNNDNSLNLHFVSARGPILAQVGKGIVMAVAEKEFELDIVMTCLQTQGESGAKATTWRITTRDPMDMFKLTQKKNKWIDNISPPRELTCPMSGITLSLPNDDEISESSYADRPSDSGAQCPMRKIRPIETDVCANSGQEQTRKTSMSNISQVTHSTDESEVSDDEFDDDDSFKPEAATQADLVKSVYSKSTSKTSSAGSTAAPNSKAQSTGLSCAMTRKLFPYHISLSKHFVILEVGEDLPKVLDIPETELVGRLIEDVFAISKPESAKWSKGWLRRLEGQNVTLDPLISGGKSIRFPGSVVTMIDALYATWLLILSPDASNLTELRNSGLTLSDLPAHGCYCDAVFLREHLSSQMQDAMKMEKLSKSLQREKGLLESLLPQHAAEGLRMGRTVEPRFHNNVTIFFSDVVGFTTICQKLYPWQVINMLNQLYCIMDFLAMKFHLFKIETIGDAYVCCSGLPESDADHARNVANFALAVRHCCRHVKSPVDGESIQLRIGIHSGSCASGIVGVTNPRYCVFGDTMNTTARHESTGLANMVHCSSVTRTELLRNAPGLFTLRRRGKVEMKGKGELTTYWLEASTSNEIFTEKGLVELEELVLKQLGQMASFEADASMESDQPLPLISPTRSSCSIGLNSGDGRDLKAMQSCLSPVTPKKEKNPFGLPQGMLLSPLPSMMMFL